MKRIFFLLIFAVMLSGLALAQRSIIESGDTYAAGDTVTFTRIYSHVGFDSLKCWISASDSVSLFVDRMPTEPTGTGTPYAKGSWAVFDSLSGTTNNGSGSGYGNLVLSTVWKATTGETGWNYYYRLRFRSTGNAASGGNYKFGLVFRKAAR